MQKLNKITILIPCYNEEKGIGKVIDGIPLVALKRYGYSVEVIVIDNNSTDKTAKIAKEKGALVITELRKGKGYAIKAGFQAVSSDSKYVVMVDGDNTYKTKETYRLIEPLESNFCDVVVGSRLNGKVRMNSLKIQNRIVNWGFTFLVRHFYRANITDVLSGFYSWKRDVVKKLNPYLESEGFDIEMEMLTKMVRLGFDIYSVPITYDQREGQSKIESMKDGLRILNMFIRNLTWKPEKASISINKTKLILDREDFNYEPK